MEELWAGLPHVLTEVFWTRYIDGLFPWTETCYFWPLFLPCLLFPFASSVASRPTGPLIPSILFCLSWLHLCPLLDPGVFLFFFFNVILFINFWLPWVFVVGHGLLIAVASCWGAQALGAWASAVVAHRLSCPYGIWNLPRPGIKPVSPALADGFLHPLHHQGGPGPVLILGEDYTVLSSFYIAKTVLLYINISMRKVFFLLFYRWRTRDAEK